MSGECDKCGNHCMECLCKKSALDHQEGGNHYKSKTIQPVEYCMANGIGFMEGCVIKYATRWRDKGGVQDLKKARHFLDMLIEWEQRNDGPEKV